jgi:hypothetical protein
LQLDFISVDAWQAFGELCLHRDVILCYLAVGQTNDLKHRCIYIEGIVSKASLRGGAFLMRARIRAMTSMARSPS